MAIWPDGSVPLVPSLLSHRLPLVHWLPWASHFVVNLMTAQALGLTFPNEILLQVTEVVPWVAGVPVTPRPLRGNWERPAVQWLSWWR
jgi:hypothetical protein